MDDQSGEIRKRPESWANGIEVLSVLAHNLGPTPNKMGKGRKEEDSVQ